MPSLGLSSGTPVNFFGSGDAPALVLPSSYPSDIGASGTGANEVRVYRFYNPSQILVSSIHFRVSAASAGNFASVGIYSGDGNTLLITAGAVSTATTGAKSVTLGTPVVLAPGYYYMAWTLSSAAPDISAVPSPANLSLILNAGTTLTGTAANASAAGVFPATLGAITAADVNIAIFKLQG